MGGRGSKSNIANKSTPSVGIPIPTTSPVADQVPDDTNTPVVQSASTKISTMTDDELVQLWNDSKSVDMPNHISDIPSATQDFVFAAGLNERPIVMDDSDFNKFVADNNISTRDILARTVDPVNFNSHGVNFKYTADDITDIMKYSKLNYIGGKRGGQVYGAGTYFDANGGRPTGYGGFGKTATAIAVLNPKTAKAISRSALLNEIPKFAKTHPKFAAALGTPKSNNYSIYALAMGYNVITDGGSYRNVIDRSALIYRKSNY